MKNEVKVVVMVSSLFIYPKEQSQKEKPGKLCTTNSGRFTAPY